MAKTRKPLDSEMVRRREMCAKLEMNLAELNLQVRTTNCLEDHGISTVGELLKHSPDSEFPELRTAYARRSLFGAFRNWFRSSFSAQGGERLRAGGGEGYFSAD